MDTDVVSCSYYATQVGAYKHNTHIRLKLVLKVNELVSYRNKMFEYRYFNGFKIWHLEALQIRRFNHVSPHIVVINRSLSSLQHRGHIYELLVYTLVGTLDSFKYSASKVWNDLLSPERDCHIFSQCFKWSLSRQTLEVGVVV